VPLATTPTADRAPTRVRTVDLGFNERFDPSLSDRLDKRPVIALILVGILDRDRPDRGIHSMVKEEMAKYSVTKQYDDLIGHYQTDPMGNLGSIFGGSAAKPSLNIDDYVVRKALHELFFEVGQEEEKISTTPAAKMTPKLSEATLLDRWRGKQSCAG